MFKTEMHAEPTASPRRRVPIALALAVACAAAGLAAGSPPAADAVRAKVLGKTDGFPRASCPTPRNPSPREECEAVGSVTGFQRVAKGKKNPFRAREGGQLVAWSMRLANPTADEEQFFGNFFENENFGKDPSARIAVIRRVGRATYRLKRQGPAINLDKVHDGRTHYFTLNNPLKFSREDLIAISIPTWAAFFAHDLQPRANEWRASRRAGKCNGDNNIKNGRPHQDVGSKRVYGCDYRGARLLYWAYYAPD